MSAEDPVTLVPARILNEHVYCPRLAYLMWVDHENTHNAATLEGELAHRRVDRGHGAVASPNDADRPTVVRSLQLASERIGVAARVDLVELDGRRAVPVEYKRGHPIAPDRPLHDPELVQLTAQVLLLRESGFEVDHGEVYFAVTHSRHPVEITPELEERARIAVGEVLENASKPAAPPPLVDSPKCPHCVLLNLCMPDETEVLRGERSEPPRRLIAGDPPAHPLYLTEPGSRLAKRGGRLVLRVDRTDAASVRMLDVAHVAAFGNADISSAAMRACFEAGIPVLWLTSGGWLVGYGGPASGSSVRLRMRQHRTAMVGQPGLCARFVAGKLRNARTLLRRHLGTEASRTVAQLKALAAQAEQEDDPQRLLGIEGTGARLYFPRFVEMLRGRLGPLEFGERTRRPPRDPVNALLSFCYAMLTKDATAATLAAGLDPFVGIYHRPRFGRPALALDLMEEFRPLVADSAVLRMVNNGEIGDDDFVRGATGVALTQPGRRRVIAAYERRMCEQLRHPLFGYKTSYRRALEIQARLLAAVLLGELSEYRPLTTR